LLILDALRDGPKHGYEIIKALEERSGGRYAPSPGTVYPTLQMLEDLGMIAADTAGDKKVYNLTDQGRAELEANAEHVDGFWQRFGPGDSEYETEIRFLREEIEHLARIVRSAVAEARSAGGAEAVRAVRQVVEKCQDEVRKLGEQGSR
jgi:DNA-binding PadR family transcriptional regulator